MAVVFIFVFFFLCIFIVPRPNMDKYVFLKVLENQDQVMIDPEYVIVPLLLHHDLPVFDYKRFLSEFHDKFFPRITCMVPTLLI